MKRSVPLALAPFLVTAVVLATGCATPSLPRTAGPLPPATPEDESPALLDPNLASETAPQDYRVRFVTSRGDFVVAVHRSWAPEGADRLWNLVRADFFENVAFFRVVEGFVAQFGLHGDPQVSEAWREAKIPDDPVEVSNAEGRVTFAAAGPDTRTTQLFINLSDNERLDAMGFAPVGEVVEGMDVVHSLYPGYGEGPPAGSGPSQALIRARGNPWLVERFPKVDYVLGAEVVEP